MCILSLPLAYLVLVRSGLALGFFEAILDPPTFAGGTRQFLDGRSGQSVCQVEGLFVRFVEVALDQQPSTHPDLVQPVIQSEAGPVVEAIAFAALPGRRRTQEASGSPLTSILTW